MMACHIVDEPINGDELKYYFKKFDTNGDGFITSDELRTVMKTFGGKCYSKKDIDDMIKEADMDSDGKVSYDGKLYSCSLFLAQSIAGEHVRRMARIGERAQESFT